MHCFQWCEHGFTDVVDIVGYYHTCQSRAIRKCPVSNIKKAIAHLYAGQVGTVIEHIIPDGFDCIRDDDAGETGIATEDTVPDVRHRQPAEGIGDDNIAAGAGVAGDSALTVTMVVPSVLIVPQCRRQTAKS